MAFEIEFGDPLLQPIRHFRASGLDWTIARLGFLTNDTADNYRVERDALPERGGSIPRATVAQFLLMETTRSEHIGQIVGLGGPIKRGV